MKKIAKLIIPALLAILVFGIAGFFIWAQDTLMPTKVALAALESDDKVSIETRDGLIIFQPVANPDPATGFIFYPGAKVEPESYAPPLRKVAEAGYLVILVPVRLNLAFFDVNAAASAFELFPNVKHWAIGGHSLGGVAAASFAAENEKIQGIIFWASYPSDASLLDKAIKITSIYGTNDGLSTPEKIEESKTLLPETTDYVAIEGGNHSQFGAYGSQDGDNPADIPAEAQWQQVANATAKLLSQLSSMPDISVDAPTPVPGEPTAMPEPDSTPETTTPNPAYP